MTLGIRVRGEAGISGQREVHGQRCVGCLRGHNKACEVTMVPPAAETDKSREGVGLCRVFRLFSVRTDTGQSKAFPMARACVIFSHLLSLVLKYPA